MADSSSTDPGRPSLLHRAGAAAADIGSLGAGRPKLRAAIQYGLIAIVFGFLALFLITQWNRLPSYDWRFQPAWLAVAFVLVLTFYSLQPLLWMVILAGLGERGDRVQLGAVWAKSLLARYVPTSALLVVGRVVLAERAGITMRVCLASVVYELAIGFSAAVIGGAYFFIKLPALQHTDLRYAILLVIPIALVGLHPRAFKPIADWALAKLGREPLPRALPYRLVLLLLPAYLTGWLLVGAGLFAFALALQSLPVDKLPYIAAAYPVAFCVSVLTFIVPSGLGARDATLATAIDAVLPLTVATAIAVAFRIFQTVVELMFVGLLVLLARRRRPPHAVASLLAAVAAVALLVPAAASAADPGAATITACKGDSVTVVGKVAVSGSAARKVHGAKLQMRFQALALFGFPRAGNWKDSGRKRSGSGQEAFSGLPADNWIGVLDWRFKRGRRTVLAGIARSEPVRIGRAKGRANCILAEGAKPVDSTPPVLYINPSDDKWHHGPAPVQLIAQDAFSGVKSMRYSLDGGPMTPITNGRGFTIAAEGAHTIDWEATDVAGNTATRSATIRVDSAPPTKPALTKPGSVTANPNPVFAWSASTDSGSGLRGYAITIRRMDGSVVAVQFADPAATSATSSATLNDGETYTATVTAVDNTVGPAWSTDSDPVTFKVDKTPDVTSAAPADGTVLSGGAKSGNFTLNLDRRADPATITSTTVVLQNVDTGNDIQSSAVGCAATPCTAIVLDPQPSPLPEGRYTLTLNGVKTGDGEGLTFQHYTARYSVPFYESAGGIDANGGSCAVPAPTTQVVTITTSATTESATLSFDWSFSGGTSWAVEIVPTSNTSNVLGSTGGVNGSGHVSVPFQIPSGTSSLTIRLTRGCPNAGSSPGTLDTNNMLGARVP